MHSHAIALRRVEDKVDALYAAQVRLIDALGQLAVTIANPIMMTQGDLDQLDVSTAPASRWAEIFAALSRQKGEPTANADGNTSTMRAPPAEPAPGVDPEDRASNGGPTLMPGDGYSDLVAELAEMREEDEIPPPPVAADEIWGRRLQMLFSNGIWMPAWGARPGQEGCQVPSEMLNRAGR